MYGILSICSNASSFVMVMSSFNQIGYRVRIYFTIDKGRISKDVLYKETGLLIGEIRICLLKTVCYNAGSVKSCGREAVRLILTGDKGICTD